MSITKRWALLLGSIAALLTVVSPLAAATTWENVGDTAFTATAGPITLTAGGVSLVCTGADATGVMATSPFVGETWPAARIRTTHTGCTLAGVPTTWDCESEATFNREDGINVSGDFDETCSVLQGGVLRCHSEATLPADWKSWTLTMWGTWFKTGGVTRVTGIAAGTCALGTSAVATNTTQEFTITNATGGPSSTHTGPTVVRTP